MRNVNIIYLDINGILNDVEGRIFDISNIKKTKATRIDVQSIIFSAASLGKQNNVIVKTEIINVGTIKFIV
jgi:hypothetical protein